jgi:hypothetical protein
MRTKGKHTKPNMFFARGDLTYSNSMKHVALPARRNQLRSTWFVVLAYVFSEGSLSLPSSARSRQGRGYHVPVLVMIWPVFLTWKDLGSGSVHVSHCGFEMTRLLALE